MSVCRCGHTADKHYRPVHLGGYSSNKPCQSRFRLGAYDTKRCSCRNFVAEAAQPKLVGPAA